MNVTHSQSVSVEGAVALSLKYWRVLCASVFVFVSGSIAYVLLATPMYRAELTLAPVRQQEPSAIISQLGGLASLAGISLGANGSSQNALAVLSSRAFLRSFISKYELESVVLPDWEEVASTSDSARMRAVDRKLNAAVDEFKEEVLVIQTDAKTGLVSVYIDWSDPSIAADWANTLAREVNTYIRVRDELQAQKNLKYLQEQLERAPLLAMQEAISRLIESEMNTAMLAQGREEYAFEIIDPAVVPLSRHSPRTVLVSVLAVLLGILVGLGTASILEARRQIAKSADESFR